jgi:hypothetical protein
MTLPNTCENTNHDNIICTDPNLFRGEQMRMGDDKPLHDTADSTLFDCLTRKLSFQPSA